MEWPATATTAASGRNREKLLGQRPARRKRERSGYWVPQPVFICVESSPPSCRIAASARHAAPNKKAPLSLARQRGKKGNRFRR